MPDPYSGADLKAVFSEKHTVKIRLLFIVPGAALFDDPADIAVTVQVQGKMANKAVDVGGKLRHRTAAKQLSRRTEKAQGSLLMHERAQPPHDIAAQGLIVEKQIRAMKPQVVKTLAAVYNGAHSYGGLGQYVLTKAVMGISSWHGKNPFLRLHKDRLFKRKAGLYMNSDYLEASWRTQRQRSSAPLRRSS